MHRRHVYAQAYAEVESRFDFLNPRNVRDANGKRPADPEYDGRTVHVPPAKLSTMSGKPRRYGPHEHNPVTCRAVMLSFRMISTLATFG